MRQARFLYTISRGTTELDGVCDAGRRGTYTHLTSWLTDARNLTNPSTTILLIGNKKDLEAQREVTYEEASKFAQENGIVLLVVSARTDIRALGLIFLEASAKTCVHLLLFNCLRCRLMLAQWRECGGSVHANSNNYIYKCTGRNVRIKKETRIVPSSSRSSLTGIFFCGTQQRDGAGRRRGAQAHVIRARARRARRERRPRLGCQERA